MATIQSLHCNYSESESKEHKMTNLEVVLKKELPRVFTRHRSLTCITTPRPNW